MMPEVLARYQRAMQIWPELANGEGGVPPFPEWMGRLVRANDGATLQRARNRMKVRGNAFWLADDVVADSPEEALLNAMLLAGRVA